MKIKVLLVSSSLGRLNELKNMLSDDEIVIAGVSSGGNDALERVANLLGSPWDDELESFRHAGDGATVRWLHQVG